LLPALNEDTSINLCTFHKINHNFKNTKYYTPKQSLYYLPGEKNAQHTLEYFRLFNSTKYYLKDYPYIDSTSKLSPYISNGEISIRSIYSAFKDDDLYVSFLRQIIFSEYTRYLLLQFPDLDKISVNSKIENIGWKFNEEYFTAWCEGQTGYLMVDAAMRQLQECGYISNRLRMIAASFCVKQLNIPWQYGADWFRINLIDFDIARNSFNWQWIAGAIGPIYNYVTRCINPNLQLKKLDPNLAYVKLFIKEINNSNFSYITPIVKFEDTVLQIKKRFLLLFPKS
jgi:deoxyribodipyrimidine photo-lyase